ncbi:MAG: GNAT family N-acetyltransferase [Bacillota bacterium]
MQSIEEYYNQPERFGLNWPFVFATPLWLQCWWKVFGFEYNLFVRSIYQDDRLIGIAPLMLVNGGKDAFLIGSPDVSDYLDFITTGSVKDEKLFFQNLTEQLKEVGVKRLVLNAQRPDSAIFRGVFFPNTDDTEKTTGVEIKGVEASFISQDQSFELKLASDWDSYLAGLKKKQRHEVRRKLRRLEDKGGSYSFRVIEQPQEIEEFYPEFIELFKQNPEKADFLDEQMARYFKTLVLSTAEAGLARFGLLELEGKVVAAVLYFDYKNCIYLYNSGYNSDYHNLSVGLLSKVLAIKYCVEQDKKIFDFLKGEEIYKSRLGGAALPIYRVSLAIS